MEQQCDNIYGHRVDSRNIYRNSNEHNNGLYSYLLSYSWIYHTFTYRDLYTGGKYQLRYAKWKCYGYD